MAENGGRVEIDDDNDDDDDDDNDKGGDYGGIRIINACILR